MGRVVGRPVFGKASVSASLTRATQMSLCPRSSPMWRRGTWCSWTAGTSAPSPTLRRGLRSVKRVPLTGWVGQGRGSGCLGFPGDIGWAPFPSRCPRASVRLFISSSIQWEWRCSPRKAVVIQPLGKYLLSTCCLPGTVLSSEQDKVPLVGLLQTVAHGEGKPAGGGALVYGHLGEPRGRA